MSDDPNFIDEGYIKFHCDWVNAPLTVPVPDDIIGWRNKMHEEKLIGHYLHLNVGYGNLSVKTPDGILISGTQTGEVFPILEKHFTLVKAYNISENSVACMGSVKASSETLTHAAVYEADSTINAIIHVHNLELWKNLMNNVPTTIRDVPYGTPEMAKEIFRLFRESNVKEEKIIVMGGHEEGIIAFGKNLEEAGEKLLSYIT